MNRQCHGKLLKLCVQELWVKELGFGELKDIFCVVDFNRRQLTLLLRLLNFDNINCKRNILNR